jgi:glycosyltransferase involved in cell wall biosynthesis
VPAVSVVIPTYKRASVIGNAIESVLAQSFQDFEVLVADDASPDDTENVVRGFRDPRIRYLRQTKNSGDAAARNLGVRHASGEFIAFLDDDDEWLPEKLRLQVEFLSQDVKDLGGVHTARFTIDRAQGSVLTHCLPPEKRVPHPSISITTSAMMMRRCCFERLGLFDESIPYCSDFDMWMRLTARYQVGYIEEPLVRYYVNSGSLSTNFAAMSQGEALLLQKHLDRFSQYPSLLGRRYLNLGVLYCSAGDASRGRWAFSRAIRWNPLEVRGYFNFAISLLGANGYRRAKAFKQRLRESVAR